MNESHYNSAPSDSAPYPSAAASALRGRSGRIAYLLLAAVALLLALQWWHSRTEIRNLRREMAQRIQSGESVSAESRNIAKSTQDDVKELQSKVSVLEGKQVEGQSQQVALEQMYQELSRNRDDWALAEIEQVLSTASQQLQLAGNVQGALIALQNADARLSRSDKPQFITIRRALARDIDKLKALPTVDITGIALRLDSLIGQVDGLPLLAGEKPAAPAAEPKGKAGAPHAADAGWLPGLKEKWRGFSEDMWNEMRQLVQVRRVNTPEALLLSPGEAYYARENLKLRLLSARLSLLSRNENAFRSDLAAAQDTIKRYFDGRARQTQATLALLKQLQGSDLAIEMPTLNDSLNAVRGYKAKP
jgi:uroporphyrin-3 C-methyltransferase/uroporphyrinogen III methyltransferase/synthase